MSWSSLRAVLALSAGLAAAACGFQLQGAYELPPALDRVYISTADRYTEFHRALVAALLRRGLEVTDDPAEATAVLEIARDETGRRVLSVSARNVPREFEVWYALDYSVRGPEGTLLERQSITLARDYTWRETEVLGKEREEAILRAALVEDLVRQVLRQLASIG